MNRFGQITLLIVGLGFGSHSNGNPHIWMPRSIGCQCVPFFLCRNGTINTDGDGLLDPRTYKDDSNTPVPDKCPTGEICCSLDSDGQVTTEEDIAKDIYTTEKPKTPFDDKCGIRNSDGLSGRIMTPDVNPESKFGEWPWHAALLKKENGLTIYQCGAVLINDRHLLTVAHCVSNFSHTHRNQVIVRLGEWDTQYGNEPLPHEDFTVSDIQVHPEYSKKGYRNDIAVLRLSKKVTFKKHINPVCLPTSGENFEKALCIATGWGKNEYRGGKYSAVLKQVQLPIIPFNKCQELLRETRLGYAFKLHKNTLCAGGEPKRDSCKGDGGGPLHCQRENGSYALAGLTSWGLDCGHKDVPGAYANVEKLLPWILKVAEVAH